MKNNGDTVHPKILEILQKLHLNTPEKKQDQDLQKILIELSEQYFEIELDRDLLEKSLKLASDEMQDHFAQVAQASKMASLGEMAGNIAHEINNPLQVLLTTSQVIQNEIQKEAFNKSDILKRAKNMEFHANRISKIIKGLKSISRDSSKDNFIETNIKDIINEILSLCKFKIMEAGIELRMTEDVPNILFRSRPSQISQVVLNLINNAFYAVVNSKSREAKWISLNIQGNTEFLEIQISDSGDGVPDEVAKKIMEPFYTTKPVGEGTGLGLSVSTSIAKDHGGYLILNRDISKSCFVFKVAINPTTSNKLKDAA